MITDSIASVYKRTGAKNDRGQIANTFAYAGTVSINIQPVALTEADMKAWGISSLQSDAKKAFFYPTAVVNVLDQLTDSWGQRYEVRALNRWGSPPFGHYEALLIPVQGV